MTYSPEFLEQLGLTNEEFQVAEIFMPHYIRSVSKTVVEETNFVHYTSAETAVKILDKQSIWMRHTATMNDYLEIEYGLDLLSDTYNNREEGTLFKKALEKAHHGIVKKIEDLFNTWGPIFRDETYITCLSEHDDSENQHGKLSMWRAYGRPHGIAMVINNKALIHSTQTLKAYSSIVAYPTEKEFHAFFGELATSLEGNTDILSKMDEEQVIYYVINAFRVAIISTKHPGFEEEKEWRIFHTPAYDGTSELLQKSREIVNGTPQTVYKIPLDNDGIKESYNITIPELLECIIVGPTEHPNQIRDTFVELLKERNVPDAENKVIISGIPLR